MRKSDYKLPQPGETLRDIQKRSSQNKSVMLDKRDLEKTVKGKGIVFSFELLDMQSEMFTVECFFQGGCELTPRWFVDFMGFLKDLSNIERKHLGGIPKYDAHPIDWIGANVNCPKLCAEGAVPIEEQEWWQIRLDRSKGRIHGFWIDNVFYVYWTDPLHNLSDSPHYPKAKKYPPPKTSYEVLSEQNNQLRLDVASVTKEKEEIKEEYLACMDNCPK